MSQLVQNIGIGGIVLLALFIAAVIVVIALSMYKNSLFI